MPASPAANHEQKQKTSAGTPNKSAIASTQLEPDSDDPKKPVRLHITPLTPALLKAYLAPSILPLATNISYHTVETFPEKGFGYVELPAMEAAKLKKKLNGSVLKGSKVRIEEAKPEKRKAADDDAEVEDDQPKKRTKREKSKKEQGVLEGVELPEGRKVKRGWTEPAAKSKKEKKDKKDKSEQKKSKYTKEPELLFNAKLTPVAAAEVARKEKTKVKKKDKKDKNKKDNEVVVHEFERSTKTPSFLKTAQVSSDPKPAVEYVNGKGWVDEDGNVVEAETGKARNRRVLELVDSTSPQPQPSIEGKTSAKPKAEPAPKSKSKAAKNKTKKQVTPPTPSSESGSDDEESSVVSSSSEDESSEADSDAESSASSPAIAPGAPAIALTPSSPATEKTEVHPLEALFKRPKPGPISTPKSKSDSRPSSAKGLAPINTSFSFFSNDNDGENMDIDTTSGADNPNHPPMTPFTQKDLEWRGLRSAAPTPDTAAIGRRFSFPWRNGSQEVDDEDEDDDVEAGKQLSNNTKANSAVNHLPGLAEEDEDGGEDEEDDQAEGGSNQPSVGVRRSKRGKENEEADEEEEEEKEESAFAKKFWENRGDNNRAWKKRRRDTLKSKRLRENKKLTGSRRTG
jgi:hypothetical protein